MEVSERRSAHVSIVNPDRTDNGPADTPASDTEHGPSELNVVFFICFLSLWYNVGLPSETERPRMSRTKAAFCLVLTIILSLNFSQAQEPLPVHPGYTIKLDVKFDGPDANKIKTVSLYLGPKAGSTVPTDQRGFTNGFRAPSVQSIDGVFHPELTIPPDFANGDYVLTITAIAQIGSVDYTAGDQFQLHDFHVQNKSTLVAPKINVKELP